MIFRGEIWSEGFLRGGDSIEMAYSNFRIPEEIDIPGEYFLRPLSDLPDHGRQIRRSEFD